MGEKPSGRENPQRRRRRLLLGGALSLGLVYAILVQIDPMGYGSRDAKRGTQYSALGSKGKKMVSSTAKHADSALSMLREELEELQEENSALRSRQTALLEAIEGSMNKDQLADGLRDFLQAQEGATQSGAPLVAKKEKKEGWSLLGKKREKAPAKEKAKALRQEKETAKPSPAAGLGEEGGRKFVMFKHRETGSYAEVNGNDKWLHATGDALGPMGPRVFEVQLQAAGEFEGEGEVMLRSLLTGGFVRLVPPSMEPAWVLVADGTEEQAAAGGAFIFELQQDKYVFSPHTGAYMNVITGAQGALRGHGNEPRKNFAAEREPSAEWVLEWVSEEEVEDDRERVEEEERLQAAGDEELIKKIHELPPSDEVRVISYGLYGSNPKYTNGAIRNAELVDTYFPGWVARFYLDDSVPLAVVEKLKGLKAEIVRIKGMEGSIAGMFWRFLVADDPQVDRYIVRDSDSRLNARDRFAVEEWIRSNKSIHSVRDHVNHCRPLNGGLWGGRHGAIKDMTKRVKAWTRKSSYGEDLSFLNQDIWPTVIDDQISHDAYCCEQFPNAHPFPTKRYADYQHVGQVFDAQDQPRMDDINRFIKNKVISPKCRRKPDWIYG